MFFSSLIGALYETGCLLDYLKSEECDKDDVWKLCQYGISAGEPIQYLHEKVIIHRDIAARNYLLTENFQIKLSDFGMSRSNSQTYYSTSGGPIPLRW